MKIRNVLTAIFNCKNEELKIVILLFIHSFFLGLPRNFTFTASGALFLEKFRAAELAYVYIGLAIACSLAGAIYLKAGKKLAFGKLLTANLLFLAGGILILRGLLAALPDAKWPVLILAIWAYVEMVLTSIEFWPLCGRILNVRQAKRLLGVIGSGEVISGIIGGFSTPLLVNAIGTANLLFISASGLLLSIVILRIIGKEHRKIFDEMESKNEIENTKNKGRSDLLSLFKNRYTALLLFMPVFSILSLYLLDNSFNSLAQLRYPNTNELAAFFGLFSAIINLLIFMGKTFLAGPLLARYGIRVGLLSHPIVVFIGAAAFVAAAFHYGLETPVIGLVFWIIAVTRAAEKVSRNYIYVQSVQLTYQPLDPARRMQIQTAVEAIMEPAVCGMAGIFILVSTSQFNFTPLHLMSSVLVFLLLWALTSWKVCLEYTNVLANALKKRSFHGMDFGWEDKATVELLREKLKSPHLGEVLYAINVLEEIEPDSLASEMKNLLEHPAEEVRLDVYRRIGNLGLSELSDRICEKIDEEENPNVRSLALQTLCMINEEAFEFVVWYLEDENHIVRTGAMIGLLKNGGIEGIVSAGEKLTNMANSMDEQQRMFAARIFGSIGIAGFHRPLIKLLADPEQNVREAALEAAPKLGNPKLWPYVIRNLYEQGLRSHAVNALIKAGPTVLPMLETEFDKPEQDSTIRSRIARICGLIGGSVAVSFLERRIDFPEESIRHAILIALKKCQYQTENPEIITKLKKLINEEADSVCWTLASLADIGEDENALLLIRALKNELTKKKERIFCLLSFLYDAETIGRAYTNLSSDMDDKKSVALELLDSLISRELRDVVFPVIEELPFEVRLKRLRAFFGHSSLGRDGRLREIIFHSEKTTTSWTKSCALYMVGKVCITSLHDAAVSALSSPEELLRETAVWAMGHLAPENLTRVLSSMFSDPSPKVADMARFVVNTVGLAAMSIPIRHLKSSGQYEIDFFVRMMEDKSESLARRKRAARILSMTAQPIAYEKLLGFLLSCDDNELSGEAASALCTFNYDFPVSHKKRINNFLQKWEETYRYFLTLWSLFDSSEGLEFVKKGADAELKLFRQQAVHFLRLFFPEIRQTAPEWLITPEDENDEIEIPELKKLSSDFINSTSLQTLCTISSTPGGRKICSRLHIMPAEQEIPEVISRIAFEKNCFSNWLKACAIREIEILNLTRFGSDLCRISLESNLGFFLREAAISALSKTDPMQLEIFMEILNNDRDPRIRNCLKNIEKEGSL
jgi:ATP/ADP translocase/HEAT repeat protein